MPAAQVRQQTAWQRRRLPLVGLDGAARSAVGLLVVPSLGMREHTTVAVVPYSLANLRHCFTPNAAGSRRNMCMVE
jgi:hypothetical protein